ncbi:MAG: thiamine pyrophosphate-binding protein [Candidatus Rokubacteria bacterium]|nr:thiamine pyrophosphate-binding protein [Candidatus Rokubacteria bacterium]
MKAAQVLMQILRAEGVRYLFGNPGTTELTFLDALPDSGLEYILALQEATAVAAADGYAQASGTVGVVNLHVAPGVANGLSILHSASRAKTPLVLTAGQQDSRFLFQDPILSGDLVQLTEQFTKWSYEIRRAEEAPAALRRALTLAKTPPTGPVFLSLPMDLMTHVVEDQGAPTPPVATRTLPNPAALRAAAETLSRAKAPLIVAGDGVARSDAVGELVGLAELIGARVYGEPVYRRTNFPGDHPLWRGGLFPSAPGARKALNDADCALMVGASVFTWFTYAPGEPFAPGQVVIQLDDDPREIGKNYPVTQGIAADPRSTLVALAREVGALMTETARATARARTAEVAKAKATYQKGLAATAEADKDRTPISAAFLMQTLSQVAPDDVVIVDETASSIRYVLGYLPFKRAGSFYGSKTGTLGWGMGAAIGVQLADPGRKVVATIGDGSVMYACQALWTAAHYRLPITYVVPNNASYAILKIGMRGMGLDSAKRGIYPGMDLVEPEIDYVALARSMGVEAERVERPGDLRAALEKMLAAGGPTLVDVAIDRSVKSER